MVKRDGRPRKARLIFPTRPHAYDESPAPSKVIAGRPNDPPWQDATLNGLPADRCERLKWIKDRTVADMGKLDLLPFFINAISKASVPGMWASNGSTDASKSLAGICRISGAAFCHGQWAPFRAFWDLAAIATLKASDGEKAELTIIASMTIGAAKHPDDRATSTRAHRASANTTNGSGPNRAGPSTVHRAVQAHILRT